MKNILSFLFSRRNYEDMKDKKHKTILENIRLLFKVSLPTGLTPRQEKEVLERFDEVIHFACNGNGCPDCENIKWNIKEP